MSTQEAISYLVGKKVIVVAKKTPAWRKYWRAVRRKES
jgi:hypothetical protein